MQDKLLTLAIPTYNMEEYLEKCIRSCVCVNMEYLELIIVNDGSQDRSSEIGHQFEKEFPDIVRVFDKENGNYGTCVNKAIAEARGKYFKMLDPDDWVDTKALNMLLDKMKALDSDLIVTVSEDRFLGKEIICRMDIPDGVEEGHIYAANSFDGIKMKAKYLYCSHSLTYKTGLLRQIGLHLQEGISYTDNEFVFYPLNHIKTIVFYNLPLYQYFVGRPGSTTIDGDLKMQTQMWLVLKGMYDYFFEHFDETAEPVRNNQRIVLARMVTWILCPVFGNLTTGHFTRSEQKENFLFKLQPYICRDNCIKELVMSYFRTFRFNWYGHYCKSGKLLEFNPFLDINITFSYLCWYFERTLMLFGVHLDHRHE